MHIITTKIQYPGDLVESGNHTKIDAIGLHLFADACHLVLTAFARKLQGQYEHWVLRDRGTVLPNAAEWVSDASQ